MRCALLLGLTALLASPVQAANPDLLDVVPANAGIVFGANGLKPFTDKLDKLIVDVDPAQAGIGAIVALMANQAGLGTALDHQAPMAFVMASPQDVLGKGIANLGPDEAQKLFVGIVGYLDEQKLAQDMGLDRQTLQPDKVFTWKHDTFPQPMQCVIKDKRLFIAASEKAIESVRKGKRLREELSKEHARTLGQADVLLLVNPTGWDTEWKASLQILRQQLPIPANDEGQIIRDIFTLLGEVRYFAVGVRLDGGVGVNAVVAFPQDPKVAAILGRLSKSDNSTLSGLPVPTGSLLFAQGLGGDGKEASALLSLITSLEKAGGFSLHSLFAPADRPGVQTALAALWKQVKANRMALYQTKDPRAGQLAALAILDTDDPATFVTEIRKFVRPGNPNELKSEPAPKDDRPVIEQLIKSLGSEDFDVREKATTQLTAIGRPALPYLEEAMKSPDAEISRRAKDLHAEINQGAAEKRNELLSGKLPYQVAPTLVYFPAAEKLGGHDVDLIRILLDPKDEALAPKLRELLGPDWNRIRLVKLDKQVVVLFGSDKVLLETALANRKMTEVGLAKWTTLKEFFARSDPSRKMEMHGSLVRLLSLTQQAADQRFKEGDKVGVTSVSFSAAPDRLQVDFWMPMTEIRGMVFLILQQQKHG
jgi:hypothetical protein